VSVRSPSDLGYDDAGFVLPKLNIQEEVLSLTAPVGDALFPEMGMKGLSGRLAARRTALVDRVEACARLVQNGEQWILWCGLNAESDALAKAIPDAVNVEGSDSYSEKVGAVQAFVRGDIRVLISKVDILGFGMNFQHCHNMAFVGLSDSYESYYQAIRRCWRYGQSRPVNVHIVVSEAEQMVVENVRRKEARASELGEQLLRHLQVFEREEVVGAA
jgi:superfamily II DNA or RNA helicase